MDKKALKSVVEFWLFVAVGSAFTLGTIWLAVNNGLGWLLLFAVPLFSFVSVMIYQVEKKNNV